MSSSLNCRPSELLGIQGVLEAYCLDQVTWYAGSMIDSELDSAVNDAVNGKSKHKGKADMARQRVLRKYFGSEKTAKQYADPSAMINP